MPSRSVSPRWYNPEITVQNTLALGNRQLVIRAGKVIHPNELITCFGQRGDGLLQNIQLLLWAGQVSIFDFSCAAKQRWQVRIVKDTQAVGIELSHPLQGKGKAFRRLFWQTIDEVNVGRGKANLTRTINQCKDKLLVLLTVYRALNFFIEVLHPMLRRLKPSARK